jgi:hypothetical protein
MHRSSGDIATGVDTMGVAAKVELHDKARWRCDWLLEKWSDEACDFVRRQLESQGVSHIGAEIVAKPTGRINKAVSAIMGRPIEFYKVEQRIMPITQGISSAELRKLIAPEVVEEIPGNLLLNEGINEMLDLLSAVAGTTAYNNANADIGVGDSNTAESATQTDLQAATNKLFKAMNATYPQRGSQVTTFQSDFTNAEANFAWQEGSIRNGNTRNKNLNRKVQNMGTKASGTWTLTATVTIS